MKILSKSFILLIISSFFSIGLIELYLRTSKVTLPTRSYDGFLYRSYSSAELDQNLPFRHELHGGNCIENKFQNMNWHPRFGFNDKNVNIDCVDKLFKKGKKNFVFIGGSAMANYETPNYLTSIEYYLFADNSDFRSINLSESGARLSNGLSIFLEYIPKLKIKPDLIIFDGYNEFNSVKYNGKYDDDFYWTLGVKKRIHNPVGFIIDEIISKLETTKLISSLLNNNTFINSKTQEFDKVKVIQSAQDYIYRKNIIEKLCDIYKIKCKFIIQPNFALSKNLDGKSDKMIKEWQKKYFKNDKKILDIGYQKILSEDNIYNLSNIFDNKKNIHFDTIHSNKFGSEIIANNLKIIIEKELDIKL